MDFVDRILRCSDCGSDFVFTAGEQLFFFDRQFKNDPKRCKLCKAKRAGLGRTAEGAAAVAALPLSRTETRTQCSECGVETTVPFRPTQGRPVFCRSCFQTKRPPAGQAAGLTSSDLAAAGGANVSHFPSAAYASFSAAATVEGIAEMPASAIHANDGNSTGMELRAPEVGQA